ncbi:response regulator [Desulfosarcina sp. OttesenSCG-928-G10]|nr:response regulator [Desulfosarcina sp. OttesenSCG-928-G10]
MTDTPKETLLIVDDEESILEVTSDYFLAKGYQVFTAANGRAAVEILAREKIDCCFTDISMPEMDGLALAEHIHKKDNTIPVVIMTGYPSLDNVIRTLQNGVVDFLTKPVNQSQLEISLKRVLRERRLFIENLFLSKEVEAKARIEALNQELTDKVEELNTFNQIMTDFTTLGSSEDLFRRIVDLSLELTHADEAVFYVINAVTEQPVPVSRSQNGSVSLVTPTIIGSDPLMVADDPGVNRLIQVVSREEKPLLIADTGTMPDISGDIRSLMLVPLKIRDKVFGVLVSYGRHTTGQFTEKNLHYMSFMAHKAGYAIENIALYENIYDNLFATLYAFVRAIEVRDPYTQQHSIRVTRIAIAMCKEMGGSTEEQDILNVAARLHDIGKIGVRDHILLKPDQLTPEEFLVIREHPIIGADIVQRLGLWDREKNIIRWHHERYDGCGYPDGLAGEDIPMLARILSVADVYDAIASDRAYRKKMTEDHILQLMMAGAGTQFDPGVIESFRRIYQTGELTTIAMEEP